MKVRVRARKPVLMFVGVVAGLIVGFSPAAALAAGPRAGVGSCSTNVAFGLVEATTTGCLQQVTADQWQATTTVNVNGVPITPIAGTTLVLTGPSTAPPGGRISVQTPDVKIGAVTIAKGTINWNLPAGTKGEEKPVISSGMVNGEKLFGFAISGSAEIRIGWDATNNLHYFKFLGNLALPSIFKNGPGAEAGGLTAAVGLRVDAAGLHADTVKAQISNAYIGALQVKNLCLSYVGAGSSTTPCSPPLFGAQPFLTCQSPGNVARWDGSAEVVLPTADRPAIGVYAGVQNGLFSYAGGQATHLGNSVPIAQGVYLDNVALAVCVTPPPLAFKGGAGVNIGATVNGTAPVTVNGSLQYTDSRPWVIEARGNVQVFGRPVADGFFRYMSDNTIDFGFSANFDFKVASVSGSVAGWVEARTPVRFNVVGNGKVCLASVACSSGEVTASSVGLAGCFTLLDIPYPVIVKDSDWVWYKPWKVHTETHRKRVRGGVGVRWPNGSPSLMGDSCDIGPYQATRSARAAAAGTFRLTVAPGSAVLALQVQGRAAAPKLELIAPDGTRYSSPRAAAKIVAGKEVFAQDSRNATTAVDIATPRAGEWTVRPLGGSAIVAIRRANVDPPATILAGVGGSGLHRILGYSYQPDPQHSTRFVEQGADYEQELGPAAGQPCPADAGDRSRPLCGRIEFTPDGGPRGERRIYAVTTMNGEITSKQLVATYDAPAEPEPSEVPAMKVQRSNGGLRISWAPSHAPMAEAKPMVYDIDVNLSDGRKLLVVVRSFDHDATVADVSTDVQAKVTVAAVRSDETQGKQRTVTLKPGDSEAT